MERKVKVGIVGCGNISGIYFENLTKVFKNIEVAACSDVILERRNAASEKYGVPAYTTEEILANDEIEIILNLTIPALHYEICMAALSAGKNVYVEKPLSIKKEQGKEILELAAKKGLLVGCAPDTFLGGGIQTCIKLINDGWIGDILSANAFMTCHGHESWHPDPEFYYKTGGGPMFDMGPYYLTALIALVGGIKSVSAMTKMGFSERTITSEKKHGQKIEVEVPTHIAGLMEFENGAVGTIITSFDIWGAELPRIEIHGTKGSISVPDPNTFGGPVKIKCANHSDWQEMPLSHIYDENSRGLGVSDMADSIISNRKNRASGELAYHVLEVMHAFHEAADLGKNIKIESKCDTPCPLSVGLNKGFVK